MYRLSDEQLIAMCAHGRRDAMDLLVSRHHSKLLDFVYRQVHDRELADDIIQSTFIRVFEGAASYRTKASFKTWMYTIALNLIRDEYRRRSVRPELVPEDAVNIEDMNLFDLEIASPEISAINSIRDTDMWTVVDRLPENQRITIILRFRQGLTYEEIADVMHAPCGTVKSWVHHALKALHQSLKSLACED
ncbi:MAG: RNA polymerase sigma factor [Armatimonadota bacterium]